MGLIKSKDFLEDCSLTKRIILIINHICFCLKSNEENTKLLLEGGLQTDRMKDRTINEVAV